MFIQMMAGAFVMMMLSTFLCYRALEDEQPQPPAQRQTQAASLCTTQKSALLDTMRNNHVIAGATNDDKGAGL